MLDKGEGYWKLNTVEDEAFKQQLQNLIIDLTNEYADPELRWEIIKIAVKAECINQGRLKATSRNQKIVGINEKT